MKLTNTGTVKEIRDNIILADGLSNVGSEEIVDIKTKSGNISGLVLNLDDDYVGIVAIGDPQLVSEGDQIIASGKELSIDISDEILGRVINPLLEPIDGLGDLNMKNTKKINAQKIAAGVIERKDVDRPIQTGIKSIDAMIPIGRGQRELIIGDRQTGKTAIAIDTIINQKQSAETLGLPLVKCVYVAIGEKISKIAHLTEKLRETGAMEYTTVVAAGASDNASIKYIAPYIGTAIAEYFAEKGDDVLVIYDDLTKHAWAYREISLLLERPPGREAYPGDIFYLHSSLLERGVQFSDKMGGGSVTILPIIETQAGDVSAYIPTNVISITDGQIYLEPSLFNSGIRPAINVGLSVSRVGGSAQIKPMKQVAGQLRLDLAQYRELAAFAQFGSDLDEATKTKLNRGEKMTEMLKQLQYEPIPTPEQIMLIYAGTKGYLDKLEVNTIQEWEKRFRKYIQKEAQSELKKLAEGNKIEGDLEEKIQSHIEKFNETFE